MKQQFFEKYDQTECVMYGDVIVFNHCVTMVEKWRNLSGSHPKSAKVELNKSQS